MSNLTSKINGKKVLTAIAGLILSQQALAAAFSIKEQSTTYLGNAFSGTASTSEDASSNWYNPAGLTQLKHNQLVASVIYLNPRTKLTASRATFGVPVSAVVTGENPTNPTGNAIIPGLHMAWKFNPSWVFGFSVVTPYGLSTKYSGNSIARFMSTTSKLITFDLTPSIAYLINDQWSIGAGFDPTRVIATLNADTNFAGVPGYLNNNATGWGYGFHLGGLYKPTKCTSMGLTYYSRITPHLKGGASYLNTPASLRPTSFTTKIDLPDRLVYSITHDYTKCWTFLADLEWTHWSVGKYLQLDYNTGSASRLNSYFRNTWRVAVGTDYHYSKCLVFKGGLSFEESPVQLAYRNTNIPDSNRYWVGLGVKYKHGDMLALDLAYAHVFFADAGIAQVTTLGRTLYGSYSSSANMVGLQLTWNVM